MKPSDDKHADPASNGLKPLVRHVNASDLQSTAKTKRDFFYVKGLKG